MIRIYSVLLICAFYIMACDSSQEVNSLTNASENNASEKKVVAVEPIQAVNASSSITSTDVKAVAEKPKSAPTKPLKKMSLSGERVYNQSCQNCHASGAAGAPKLGDAVNWNKRIDKGIDALYSSAINGIPSTPMMPKGTCGACSDDELRAAVDFMVSKVNAN